MVLSFGSPYSIWYAVTSASAMGAAAALTYSLRSTSGTALDGLIAPSSHPTTLPAYSFMTASPVDAPRPDTEKESGTEPSSAPGPRQRALRVGLHRVRYLPQRAQELEVGRLRAHQRAGGHRALATARDRPERSARAQARIARKLPAGATRGRQTGAGRGGHPGRACL